jgi:hypothetical protein
MLSRSAPLAIGIAAAFASLACTGSDLGTSADAGVTSSTMDGASLVDRSAGDAASDSPPDATDRREPDEGPGYPAPHPPFPQVLSPGGPVLVSPRVVPILYSGDPAAGLIESFLGKLATSTYWHQVTAEYGVGSPQLAPAVILDEPAPATITDEKIQAFLVAGVEAPDAAADAGAWLPPPDGETIYAVFYPQGTSVVNDAFGSSETSCVDFGAYHYEFAYAGGKSSYAVMPRCASTTADGGVGDATSFLTLATGHELVEAATDPYPSSAPAFSQIDADGTGWGLDVGGFTELADMCFFVDDVPSITPSDLGFDVQRIWSNASAASGRDPCAPSGAGEVYFGAVPDLSTAKVSAGLSAEGLVVPPEGSATIALHLFSDGPVGPWTLSAKQPSSLAWGLGPIPPPQLSFAFDHATGGNGDVVHLTVTRGAVQGGGEVTGLPVQIESTFAGETHSYWTVVGE